jgi:formate hydrogenlyase transcriptional activator
MHHFSEYMDSKDQRHIASQPADRGENRLRSVPAHAQIDSWGDAFTGIVGSGGALQFVLNQVRAAAPTDCTVLIEGETGTGKELIARAVHKCSVRRNASLVCVNCAAVPRDLMESDLFGHEKGAFTGAVAQKLGRFELAHNGTLFLDEVGDLPLELQPKLLRALQEQEFERLGSTQTRRVNVRLVAATNHSLAQLVREGKFRSDLYYRLNIFPISLPPLRQRREDIPALVRLFVDQIARKMGKEIRVIPEETQEALAQHDWPGNIRELRNVLERAVILSNGSVLSNPLEALSRSPRAEHVTIKTLDDLQRQHILETLKETKGVIGGPRGAAACLGVKRTTLIYKMKRLGIGVIRTEAPILMESLMPLHEAIA